MFIAKKPCSFGPNHNYLIGDKIPDGVVSPNAVKRLTTMGFIVEVEAPVSFAVKVDDNTIHLTQEDLQKVVDVLTANAEEATEHIKALESMDLLFFINAADSRKTVQAAAKAQAQALSEQQEGAESEGEQ